MTKVPELRIRSINDKPLNSQGQYVIYWMLAYRRTGWNFALQRAIEQAARLSQPLIILETLPCDEPFASDRLHRFVLDGMVANARALRGQPVTYYPYIETGPNAGLELLAALTAHAGLVVTDDYPTRYFSLRLETAGKQLTVALEAVDSNGLLPMRLADHAYPTAYAFRRFLQKTLPQHLLTLPKEDPLDRVALPAPAALPPTVLKQWPEASALLLQGKSPDLSQLPIDHTIAPTRLAGGQEAAREKFESFLDQHLVGYAEARNHPDLDVTSGLSPYLHFGQISSHEIWAKLFLLEGWTPDRLGLRAIGKRTGWWGLSASTEAFLDQLVTWREIGFNMCCHEPKRYDQYSSLPAWARTTLDQHSGDPRPYCYSREELRQAKTHDELWNAAQHQLLEEGGIHNYLRMLWGKKILEWSPTPQQALANMLELNDRYALDGRDPNSYSGILWCLGRYDRPWGPTRPIFGSVRYMSSENTRRKVKLKRYLEKYG